MSTAIYLPLVDRAAEEFGLDKHLLAEQAWRESQWDPLAVNEQRHLGFMSIPPAVWAEWAPRLRVFDPFDPESNLRVAAAYLQDLRRQLATRLNLHEDYWLLVAYRWGWEPLQRFVAGGHRWEDLPAELQDYALSILLGAEARALAAAEPVSG